MTNLGLSVKWKASKRAPGEACRPPSLPRTAWVADDFPGRQDYHGQPAGCDSPFSRVSWSLVRRSAGEVVDNNKVLFVVVDVRQMWLTLDLRVDDAKLVVLGQEVRFGPDGGKEARGKITWISTEAERKTRTVKVRVSLDNGEGRRSSQHLRHGEGSSPERESGIVVPNAAVHWEGCCHVVFVRDKDFLKEGGTEGLPRPHGSSGCQGREADRDHRRGVARRSRGDQGQRRPPG